MWLHILAKYLANKILYVLQISLELDSMRKNEGICDKPFLNGLLD